MRTVLAQALAWSYAGLVASLPWVMFKWPWWTPGLVALVVMVRAVAVRRRVTEPWSALLVLLSALVFLGSLSSGRIAFGWLAAGLVVAFFAFFDARRQVLGRPDVADLLALVVWAVAIGLQPRLIEHANGGVVAPILLLFGAGQVARFYRPGRGTDATAIGPPSRLARGTLSLRGVVVGSGELRRSVPLDLEVRAGESLAVICDSAEDAEKFAEVVAGRQSPLEGEVCVDAVPLTAKDRLVAVIGLGESFLPGELTLNVGALCEDEPEFEAIASVHEACGLEDLVDALDGQEINARGEPLTRLQRLLLLAARVVPSQYRAVVVADPVCWLNAVHGELWRRAVVRASVGRTAIWFTSDRDLARRATQIMEFRHGALRHHGGFDGDEESTD